MVDSLILNSENTYFFYKSQFESIAVHSIEKNLYNVTMMQNDEQNQPNNIDEEIYQKLRVIANKLMQQERANHTLSPTDLVHEAYLKLSCSDFVKKDNKNYLFILARQMRRLLVDYGRYKSATKHGAELKKVMYTDALGINHNEKIDFSIISDAIDELETISNRCAHIIELYYFTGVSRDKTAEILNISMSTLARDIHFAKAFIGNYINENC